MTLEMAADLVKVQLDAGNWQLASDLFCVFEDYFRLTERDQDGILLEKFASMCGFLTVILED